MTRRVCLEPGCPTITTGTRCTKHTREKDAARGRRQDRGYDTAYDREHRELQRRMDAGDTFACWRCTELGQPHLVDTRPGHWHLGHDLVDRTILRGPQCPASNLADAARGAEGSRRESVEGGG